jgi:hypothetical protein
MGKRTSSKDFLKGYEAIYKNGPAVKYSNPDGWSRTPEN